MSRWDPDNLSAKEFILPAWKAWPKNLPRVVYLVTYGYAHARGTYIIYVRRLILVRKDLPVGIRRGSKVSASSIATILGMGDSANQAKSPADSPA